MPIYDQTYRRYEARGPLRRARFWPITREALRLVLVRRWFIGLLAAAWIPFAAFYTLGLARRAPPIDRDIRLSISAGRI